jgi:very-short-patch-repair endonuclease
MQRRHQSKLNPKVAAVLAERAWCMRRFPTASEAVLARAVAGERLGVAFKRQVVLGRCIADLAAPAAKLVVEVDGAVHRGREAADARRDRLLGRMGYRVLRLPAQLVLERLHEALERIRQALGQGD